MRSKLRSMNILSAALLLLTVADIRSAQTPTPTQSPATGQSTQSIEENPFKSQPAKSTLQQTQTASNGELTPVYGLQGVLIETLDGKTVSAQSVDQAFNPASSVKLATALVALQSFGAQHRFATGFWTDGPFDKANGKIVGNLYVTGRDPSFH